MAKSLAEEAKEVYESYVGKNHTRVSADNEAWQAVVDLIKNRSDQSGTPTID